MRRILQFLCFVALLLAIHAEIGIPPMRVTSPLKEANWLTCSWQAVTWDGSGYPNIKHVTVIIYGDHAVQLNLGTFSNGGGYAQLFVPKVIPSGLYRARVYGYQLPYHPGDLPIVDQSPWFRITNGGCPGVPDIPIPPPCLFSSSSSSDSSSSSTDCTSSSPSSCSSSSSS
jgi:hypothetical protein